MAKLTTTEKGELFKAVFCKWSDPMFGLEGMMSRDQWTAWKRLERLGLAEIEGMGEADDLVATDKGRSLVSALLKDSKHEAHDAN